MSGTKTKARNPFGPTKRAGRPARDDENFKPYGRLAELMDLWIGARLQYRRHSMGMTREDLAHKLGLSTGQIQGWENGNTRLPVGRLFEVALALEIHPGWFFEGADHSDILLPPEVLMGAKQMAILEDPGVLLSASIMAGLPEWQREIVTSTLAAFVKQNDTRGGEDVVD